MELKNFFAQDTSGNVIPNPTAYVYEAGTTTLATGLVDKAGAALANPFSGNDNGLVQFAAPDGEYDLRIIGAGRDFVLRIQCLDAGDVVADVEAARDAALAAQAAAEATAASAALAQHPLVAEAGASRAIVPADQQKYIRFTAAGAKTATLNVAAGFALNQEFHLANRAASGNLTLTPTGITLNAPKNGTLVLAPGDTVTVKFISASVADVFGSTVAA